MFTVRCKLAIEKCQVDPRLWHWGRQSGDEIQRLWNDVRLTTAVGCLLTVAGIAVRREQQTLLGNCLPTDVSAKPFELLALIHSP